MDRRGEIKVLKTLVFKDNKIRWSKHDETMPSGFFDFVVKFLVNVHILKKGGTSRNRLVSIRDFIDNLLM